MFNEEPPAVCVDVWYNGIAVCTTNCILLYEVSMLCVCVFVYSSKLQNNLCSKVSDLHLFYCFHTHTHTHTQRRADEIKTALQQRGFYFIKWEDF